MRKFYKIIMIAFIVMTIYTLYNLMFINHNNYTKIYEDKNNTYVSSLSTPRGRILDINGNILVDNIGVKTIVYRKINNVSIEDEIDIAYKLSEIIDVKLSDDLTLKKFFLIKYKEEADNLITREEYDLYDRRKLSSNDLYLLKMDRIDDDKLSRFKDLDKKAAQIYSLMNNGYYYDAKIIKKNCSDIEYASVLEANIKGVTNEMNFDRIYPYGNTLKTILGSIGKISEEEKDEYLEKGYSLNDIVGKSYLEKEYEEYLKGKKDKYIVNKDGTLTLVEEGTRGNDLVLSIDINMQLGLETILKEEIINGKKLPNTEYYKGSYIIVSDIFGSLKAISGLSLINKDVFEYNEADFINSSFTVGSVVKGASMAMAYNNNLVDVGKKVKDSCVKLYKVPEKCSYKSLGYIDDITALKTSSNYYQFLLAIKLAGYKYSYNMKMNVTEKEFNIYRDTFKSFGLGNKTGIDLPSESTGLKGKNIAPDLLLNLAIGQYDNYTPAELVQYINTIANNGIRYNLSLMDHIVDSCGNIKLKNEKKVLSTYNLDEFYFNRIKEGLFQVVNYGTGVGYTDTSFSPVGKTGTSESLYDSNHDGKGDKNTITNTYAMYAPFDNPKYSMVVISPNVSHYNGKTDYFAYINRFISKRASDYIFSNY